MSHAPSIAEYIRAVEELYLEATQRGLMLSAREEELVRRWARADFPLAVVLETLKASLGAEARHIRSLAYAQSAVEEAVERWRKRRVESNPFEQRYEVAQGEKEAQSAALTVLLDRLEAAGRGCEEAAVAGAIYEVWQRLRASRETLALGGEVDLISLLGALESHLEAQVVAVLSSELRCAVEAQLSEALAAESARLDAAQLEALRARWRWRAIRRHFALPAFELRMGPSTIGAQSPSQAEVRERSS